MALPEGTQAQQAQTDEDRTTDADMCMGIYTDVINADTTGDTYNARTGLAAASKVFSELTQSSDEETAAEAVDSAQIITGMVKDGDNTLEGFRQECDAEFMADKPII